MRLVIYILFLFVSQLFMGQIDKKKEIDTIVLKKETPIIIKKDTLIYDVQSFSSKHDETLEEVLAKMKGVKVLPNGEIEVNGKIVKKVLINNKEVANVGSAVITKSLSHENVEKIEVRLKEKDNKIKESLLNTEEFVSINVILKKSVNSQFFGKQKIDNNYYQNFKIGGVTNVFSINPKTNIHLFGESSNNGKTFINLHNIKNIGQDSYAKIFALPTDIEDIKNRMNYHQEIYGFDNFTANHKSILGLSINTPIDEKSDVYIGSYSDYNFMKKQVTNESFLHQQLLYRYKGDNILVEYNSKNKIQFKSITNNFKVKTDINYEYNNQRVLHNINENEQVFEKKHINKGIYINGELEYKFANHFGIYYNTNLSMNNTVIDTKLAKNILDISMTNQHFYQKHFNKDIIHRNEVGAVYTTDNTGTHTVGYRYIFNNTEDIKASNTIGFFNDKSPFVSNENTVFYKNNIRKGNLFLELGADYKWANFPDINNSKNIRKDFFQYHGDIMYSIGNFSSIKLTAQSKVSEFPMHKVLAGNVLKDFNTVFTTRQNQITPYYNRIYSIIYNNDTGANQGVTAVYTTGTSNNLNNQYYENNILYINSDQLESKYHIISIIKKGRIKKMRISYELEPEALINTSEQIINGEKENATTYRFFMGLKLQYLARSKKVKINYYPKYSSFFFENILKGEKMLSKFDFLSNSLSLNLFFLNEALKTGVTYRQVNFLKTKDDFRSLDVEAVYKTPKYRFNISINNVLNSKNFIIQDMDKSILNISNNAVFGRYISIGAEIKF